MMMEAEWQRSQQVPTVEEYMTNAVVSFALGPVVLPALYFCLYKSKTVSIYCSHESFLGPCVVRLLGTEHATFCLKTESLLVNWDKVTKYQFMVFLLHEISQEFAQYNVHVQEFWH